MSQFIGGAQPGFFLRANDNSLRRLGVSVSASAHYVPDGVGRGRGLPVGDSYRSPWWPGAGGFLGSQAADRGPQTTPSWDVFSSTKGRISRFGYAGIARDAANAPLPSVTIKLFRTVDDLKVAEDVVSGADGAFVITTPHYEGHWLYMRKAGSPNVGGVSDSTLIPNT